MSETPLISVIVPIRNEVVYLRSTIESILNQTLSSDHFEILLIDGLSDDGTRELCESLSRENPRIRLLQNPRRFVASAFNIGIRESRGDFIAIIGGHTRIESNYFEEAMKLFQAYPHIVGTGGPVLPTASRPFGKAVALAMSHPLGIGNATHRYPDFEGYAFGSAFPIFRRHLFDEVGLYDEDLVRNQDDEFLLRVQLRGLKNFISPRIRSYYHVREYPSQLWKQFFQYGYWRIAVLRKIGRFASLRQAAPFVFYSSLISSLFLYQPYALIMASIYLLAIIIACLRAIPSHDLKTLVRLPIVFILIHAGYAFGFAKGLIDFYGRRIRYQDLARLESATSLSR